MGSGTGLLPVLHACVFTPVRCVGTPAKGREPDKSNATDWEAQGPLKRLKLTYDEASGHHFMHYDANAANTIEQHEAQPTAHQQPTSSASHNKKPVYTDEHTAFVKGIGTGVSQEQLVQLFAPCGGLKSIRLAVTDHGKSRVRHIPHCLHRRRRAARFGLNVGTLCVHFTVI